MQELCLSRLHMHRSTGNRARHQSMMGRQSGPHMGQRREQPPQAAPPAAPSAWGVFRAEYSGDFPAASERPLPRPGRIYMRGLAHRESYRQKSLFMAYG